MNIRHHLPRLARASAAVAIAASVFGGPALAQDRAAVRTDVTMRGQIGPLEVLRVSITDVREGDSYDIASRTVSSGFAALFKKFDTRASITGALSGKRFTPRTMTHQNMDGKKNRKTIVTWTADDVITDAKPGYGNMGEPPATLEQKLEATDPLTALARLTAMADTPREACSQTLHVFDGKQRYDLVMSPIGPEVLSAGQSPAIPGPAFKCQMIYKEVAGFKKKKDPRADTFRTPVMVWLSAIPGHEGYVISRLRADIGFGSAIIKATKVTVSTLPPS